MSPSSAVAGFKKVKALSIQSQNVQCMPTFNKKFDKKLECFEIVDCLINTIDRSDLENFPNLKFLDLSQNNLHSLPHDLFESTLKLEFISFDRNDLQFVGQDILSPLRHLQQARFRHTCIDFFADDPEKIETLEKSLVDNCGGDINQSSVNKNDLLKHTIGAFEKHLKDQKSKSGFETTVVEERFGDTDASRTLQLKNEELAKEIEQLRHKLKTSRRILEGAGKNLVKLLPKIANEGLIEQEEITVVCESFSEEGRCVVADLHIANLHTKLGMIFDKSGDEVHPKNLIVRDQTVLFVPVDMSKDLYDLEKLEISNSGLFVIDTKSFAGLESLTLLNMSGNVISTIPAQVFSKLETLTELDLSHNNIDQIEYGAWMGLGKLKVLLLNGNKLVRSAATFNLKSLKLLDLSSNLIESLPKNLLVKLTKLTELRLSFNAIEILNVDFLPVDNKIEVFKVDNNKLKEVDTVILVEMENANVVDLTKCECVDVKFAKIIETSETALRAIFVGTSCLSA